MCYNSEHDSNHEKNLLCDKNPFPSLLQEESYLRNTKQNRKPTPGGMKVGTNEFRKIWFMSSKRRNHAHSQKLKLAEITPDPHPQKWLFDKIESNSRTWGFLQMEMIKNSDF